MKIDPDDIYTVEETSAIIKNPPSTLANWRYRGGGPRFVKFGNSVRYRGCDLIDYIEGRTFSNTSQSRSSA